MHAEVLDWVQHCIAQHGPFERVLEIGSRDINGSVRSLFGSCDYIGVDLIAGPGVDVVGDAVVLALAGELPTELDCIVTTEALEHYPRPWDVLDAARDLLRPGGVLIATMAGPGRHPHSGLIEGPVQPGEHYQNVTPAELFAWLGDDWLAVDVDQHRADLRCCARR